MVAQTPLAAVARAGPDVRVGTEPSTLAATPARPCVVAWPGALPVGAELARLAASPAWPGAAEPAMLPASAATATKAPTKIAISRRVGAGRTSGRRTLTSTPLPISPGGSRPFLQHSESGIKVYWLKTLLAAL